MPNGGIIPPPGMAGIAAMAAANIAGVIPGGKGGMPIGSAPKPGITGAPAAKAAGAAAGCAV
jgi:hypothetical protein